RRTRPPDLRARVERLRTNPVRAPAPPARPSRGARPPRVIGGGGRGGAASLPPTLINTRARADHARQHDRGAREPGQERPLAEPEAPDEGRKEDRELARRDDIADLREAE